MGACYIRPRKVTSLATLILVSLLGASMFSSVWLGLVCAGLLASMPLVWAGAGTGAAMTPWLIAITWLLCIDRFRVSRHIAWLAGAGAVLGLGLYDRPSAMLVMPAYLALSLAALVAAAPAPNHRLPVRAIAALLLAFCAVTTPFAVFLIRHPEYFRDAILARGLYDARHYNLLQGSREVFTWVGLSARVEVYWDYFNPAFLFFSGGSLAKSLAHPQVFLLPFAVLLPAGIRRVFLDGPTATWWLVMSGFLLAPLVGALTAGPPVPADFRPVVPFAALLGTGGLEHLLTAWRRSAVPSKYRGRGFAGWLPNRSRD